MMKYRIAVIEDNPADTFLLEEALNRARIDYELDRIEDGEHAVSYIESAGANRPDLFLLDLNLPKIKGADLLRMIAGEASLDGVPVIVWSSSDLPRDRAALALSRVSCFVVKPSSLDGFLEIGRTIGKLLQIPSEQLTK